MPLFSIIIPTYNRLPFLKQAIRSIQQQSFSDYETVVVDDGSTDGTSGFLGQSGSILRYVTQANRGAGAARNSGAEISEGKYLLFLDSDDLLFPWSLEVYGSILRELDRVNIIRGNLYQFHDVNQLQYVQKTRTEYKYYKHYLEACRDHVYVGSGMLVINRHIFMEVEGFNESLRNNEDHDFMLRSGMIENFVSIASPDTVARRLHKTRITGNDQADCSGTRKIIFNEQHGTYPGGDEWKRERRLIICQHARAMTANLISKRQIKDAFRVYCETFFWQCNLLRLKYILGTPLLILFNVVFKGHGNS